MSTYDAISYQGRTYKVQPSSEYYTCKRLKGGGTRLLHRHVWEDHFGTIPKGHQIHHKNEDPRDNRIENLECLSLAKHTKLHCLKRLSHPVYRKTHLANFEKTQNAARVWHASEEGLKWHSENGKRIWENRFKDKPCTCAQCGSSFLGLLEKTRYCSRKCSSKYLAENVYQKTCDCQVCGKSFQVGKYRKGLTCSPSCRNHLRYQNIRNKKMVVAQPTNS